MGAGGKGAPQFKEGAMTFHGKSAHNFSPEIIKVLERAFEDVWIVLAAHQERGSDCEPELGISVGRTLVALAANGITVKSYDAKRFRPSPSHR
jgi:hypothetical protein